jgi:Lar family restriction alleviation protein
MEELKPCPFCGGRLSSINIHKGKHGLYHADAFCLNLIECGISIDAVDVDRSRAEEKLIEHWNRRAE